MVTSNLNNNLSVFFGSKIFRVPEWQRPYAWERKNWEDVWNDIDEISEEVETGKMYHYWGNVTLLKSGETELVRGLPYDIYDIIDGQQRIVTIMLFFLALRNKIRSRNVKDDIYDKFLMCGKECRIQLGDERDSRFLSRLVEGNGETPSRQSQRRLKDAYDFFRKRIGKNAKNLYLALVRSRLLELITEDEVMAVRAFQALNDRGKLLTLLDKAKSLLLYYVIRYLPRDGSNKILKSVNDSFAKVFDGFDNVKYAGRNIGNVYLRDRLNEDEFLRLFYHYYCKSAISSFNLNQGYDYNTTSEEVVRSFIKDACLELKPQPGKGGTHRKCLGDFALDFSSQFADYSNKFGELISKGTPDKVKGAAPISTILSFQQPSAIVYPLMINLYCEDLLSDELVRLVGVLDFRLYKLRSGDPRAELYNEIVSNIKTKKSKANTIKFLRDYLNRFGKDSDVRIWLKGSLYYRNPWVRYILWEYNKKYDPSFEDYDYVKFRDEKNQIEHIFAKGFIKGEEEEKERQARKFGFEGIADYDHEIDRLGNLVLFDYNPQASDKSPRNKIRYYKKSEFPSVLDLAEEISKDGFDKEKIKRRTQEIIEFFINEWNIQ